MTMHILSLGQYKYGEGIKAVVYPKTNNSQIDTIIKAYNNSNSSWHVNKYFNFKIQFMVSLSTASVDGAFTNEALT